MKKLACFILLFCLLHDHLCAQSIIEVNGSAASFPVISAGKTATIVYDADEDSLIHKTAELLKKDIKAVSGKSIAVSNSLPSGRNIIIIGNIQRSSFIQRLIKEKKLDVSSIKKNGKPTSGN